MYGIVIDYDKRFVVVSSGYDYIGYVFVVIGNVDVGVMVLGVCDCFDIVSDNFFGL